MSKTAPFDLSLAMKGHPLVTASGEKVKDFGHNCCEGADDWPYAAQVEIDGVWVRQTYDAEGLMLFSYVNPGNLRLDISQQWVAE